MAIKRIRTIRANDGDGHDITVTVRVVSTNGLMGHEVEKQAKSLCRGIADQLRQLPYSDFGIENTRIFHGRR